MRLDSAEMLRGAWISRLLFGAGFLISAAANQLFALAVFQLLLAVALLRLFDGHFRRIIRAARLLLWIVLPMVLVHALFSPGRLVDAGWLQLSIDGALFGSWLAFHFITIFMVALLSFRILTVEEWMRLIIMVPLLRTRLLPYMVLAGPLRAENGAIVARYRGIWQRGRKGAGRLFLLLLLVVRRVLRAGPRQAAIAYSRWDAELEKMAGAKGDVLPVSMIWTLLWLIAWIGLMFGVMN